METGESPAADARTVRAGVKDTLEQGDLLLFIPLLLAGTSLLHVSLLLSASFTALDPGSFKDSMNVALAGAAVQYPVQAAQARAQSFAKTVSGASRAGTVVALLVNILFIGMSLALVYYYFRVAATMHALSMSQMWWPIILFFALAVAVIAILGYLILFWRRATVGQQRG